MRRTRPRANRARQAERSMSTSHNASSFSVLARKSDDLGDYALRAAASRPRFAACAFAIVFLTFLQGCALTPRGLDDERSRLEGAGASFQHVDPESLPR